MRVALKIAYDGSAFHGHQRQPDARTVEGECLTALRSAKIFRHPNEAFFRSASRTDRGVSAIGNVIAFNTSFRPEAVVGAFNDRARDVWAWAYAQVPEFFHPRRATERWYRYHLVDDTPVASLCRVAAVFRGEHDFRSFTSDPSAAPRTVLDLDVCGDGDFVIIDVRARSFRRGMVRRIVAAMLSYARGEVTLERIEGALRGAKRDFGIVPAEPLFLMDVRYDFSFTAMLKPKVRDEWQALAGEARRRIRLVDGLFASVGEGV